MYLLELAGEEDAFAIREAKSRCSAVEALASGLATARGVERVETLSYTTRVSRLVGTCEPTLEGCVRLLEAARTDREGSVAVRARTVRGISEIDTQELQRRLGDVLVDRGFAVDLEEPDHTLVAAVAERAAIGWVETEPPRRFVARRPTDKPFFQPGSMGPADARALANIAGAGFGRRLLDPMCGTGGVLVEAGLAGSDVVGLDAQPKMVRGSHENLTHYLEGGHEVVRGDATRLPFSDDSFDGVVFDAPYGRQSKITGRSLEELVATALQEAHRVAPRAVVVGDRPYGEAATTAGWTVESRFDRRVHRSLTRYVLVLE